MILVVAASSEPRARALVVVIGTLRGGPVAWRSLQRHVVDVLGGGGDGAATVHVALLVSNRTAPSALDAFRAQLAPRALRHVWPAGEFDDWGDALEALSARHGVSRMRRVPEEQGLEAQPQQVRLSLCSLGFVNEKLVGS